MMDLKEFRNLQEAYLNVYDDGIESYIYENIGTGKSKRARFGGIIQRPSQSEISNIRASAKESPKPISEPKPLTQRKGINILPSGGVGPSEKVLRGGYTRTPRGIASRRATELQKKSRRLDIPTSDVLKTIEREAKIRAALKKAKKWGTPEATAEEIILSHLIQEGYTNTLESAQAILENMSEDWIESIVEEYRVLPIERIQKQIDKKAQKAKNLSWERKTAKRMLNKYYKNPEGKYTEKKKGGAYYSYKLTAEKNEPHIRKIASQIKTMKSTLRNHDSLVSRIKGLENRDRGEQKINELIKRKTKGDHNEIMNEIEDESPTKIKFKRK